MFAAIAASASVLAAATLPCAAPAHADAVAGGRSYAAAMGDVKADFETSDEYQASYLITQAVGELCPELIWQLRNSAAHYPPPSP